MVSKEFFLAVKERPKSTTITTLIDRNSNQITDQASLEQVVLEFYRQLYLAPPEIPAILTVQVIILEHIPPSFIQCFSIGTL